MSPTPDFTSVRRARAYEGIVEQIEEALRTGTLQPGDRLPGEREMVEQFGVSRPTVREALRVLESAGLVQSRPGDPRGPLVVGFGADGLYRSMSRVVSISDISRVELLQFRVAMEGISCWLAADARTAEQVANMNATVDHLRDIANGTSADSFGRAVMTYHAAIRQASGNQLIEICGMAVAEVMSDVIDSRLSRESAPDRAKRLANSVKRATQIVDAIEAGDGLKAAQLARQAIVDYYQGDLDDTEAGQLDRYVAALGGS